MKYIKLFEGRGRWNDRKKKEKRPKHKYDCEPCKFNWCCGFDCACILGSKLGLPDAPEDSLYRSTKKYNL